MKSAIITFGVGYNAEDIQPFLESCKRNTPETDVYLFAGSNHRSLRTLTKTYPQLHIIRYGEAIPALVPAKILERIGLGRAYASVIRGGYKMLPGLRLVWEKMASPLLQFMARRFFHTERLMARLPHDRFMLTDIRDVLVQANPFKDVTDTTIITGTEPRRIESCPMNSSWLSRAYDPDTLQILGSKPVVCAGVTIGSRKAVAQYVREMNSEVMERLPSLAGWLGVDQAIHTKLFYHGLKGLDRFLETNGAGSIATLHYSDLKEFAVSTKGIDNFVGKKLAVVHQYDRHPKLADIMLNNFRFS